MKNQLSQTGLWHVKENGDFVYLDQENEIFTIESGCIGNPNLLYDLSCQPYFNMVDFAPKYLIAALKSDLETITLKLKDND